MQPLGQLWSCSGETSTRRSFSSASSLVKRMLVILSNRHCQHDLWIVLFLDGPVSRLLIILDLEVLSKLTKILPSGHMIIMQPGITNQIPN